MVVQEGAGREEGKIRAVSFVKTFGTLWNEIDPYVASFGSILKGRSGAARRSQVLDAVNGDLRTNAPTGRMDGNWTEFGGKAP